MLKQTNCVKLITDATGGDLEADTNESFLVKGVFVNPSDTDTFVTLKIDNVTVGFYRVYGKSGNHLGGIKGNRVGRNLMRYLVNRGLPFSLPIAEGQKLNVSRPAGANHIQVLYDRFDAGDIRADMPCGSASKNYGFLQYLRETDVLTDSGDMLLDNAITPAEFPDFPAGKAVPAKMSIKLHGIVGCPVSDFVYVTDAYRGYYSTFLKLIREREVLFDEDRDGILFEGRTDGTQELYYENIVSIIGSCADFYATVQDYAQKDPLIFEPPFDFASGEELLVYLSCIKDGVRDMTANLADVALILEVIRE